MAKSKGSEALKRWRKRQNLTQHQAAELLERAPTEISRYERGTITPGLYSAYRMVRECGIDIADWLQPVD